ncbi:hypothetical protein NMY22_g11476 [Coprinellus aureogranulatus]|nr:hypothetical protein NMY22_g11476 [Coprinellus aureogranulatus]
MDNMHLPADVWLEAITDANPSDVVSLSQTCRTMRSLLSTKPVWIRILRDLMRKYGRFAPAPSLEEMTVEELQKAALAPWRWRTLMQTNISPSANPDPSDQVEPKVIREWLNAPSEDLSDYRLVPGGRYLVTSQIAAAPPLNNSRRWHVCIVLWDLGRPCAASSVQPTRLATHILLRRREPDLVRVGMDISLVSGTVLKVVTYYASSSNSKAWARVLEAKLKPMATTLKVVAEIKRKNTRWTKKHHIHGDRVLFSCYSTGEAGQEYCLLLWDTKTSRISQWQASTGFDDSTARLTQDYALLIRPGRISAWDIARLETTSAQCISTTWANIPADWELPLGWPFHVYRMQPPVPEPLTSSLEGNSVVFEVMGIDRKTFSNSRKLHVVLYRFRLEKVSGVYQSSLEALAAGHLPESNPEYEFVVGNPPGFYSSKARFIGRFGSELEGPDAIRAYNPQATAVRDRTPADLNELASNTPIDLTYLADGIFLAACTLSGRILYAQRRGPDEIRRRRASELEVRVFCADYLS